MSSILFAAIRLRRLLDTQLKVCLPELVSILGTLRKISDENLNFSENIVRLLPPLV